MNNVDTPGVSPEMEVLLWSIRVDGQGDDRARTLLRSSVDWPELARRARSHHLSAFLYHRLKDLPDNGCSSEIEQYFRDDYRVNMHRNLLHARQLLWILQACRERGIAAIPFKGIVLAHQAYPVPDIRQCGDIDLLIMPEDLPRGIEMLEELGFSPLHPFSRELVPHIVHSIMRSETFRARNHADIDFHWGISDIFSAYPAEREFFQNARFISIFGSEVSTLSPEDTLLMLSAHGMKHFWPYLKSVTDIICLINHTPDMNLSLALATAEQRGCLRLLAGSLHLAQMMGGIGYPPPVEAVLEREAASYRIARYISRIVQLNESPEPARRLVTMLQSRERWTDALGFGLYALFSWPAPKGSRILLPRPLRPIYPVIGPLLRNSR